MVPYGILYGMHKTTIYLPEDLRAAVTRKASAEGRSEADVIREAIRRDTAMSTARPTVPLTGEPFGDPSAAERVDELLRGFGTR